MAGVAMLLLLLLMAHLAACADPSAASSLLQHVMAIAPPKPQGSVSDVLHPERWTHLNYSASNAIGLSANRLKVNISPESAVLLNIYLKAVCVEDSSSAADKCYTYDMKGYAIAEQSYIPQHWYGTKQRVKWFQLPRPDNFNKWSHNVTVESPATQRIIPLEVDVPIERQANMILGPTRITLTEEEARNSGLEVRVPDDTFYGHQQLDPYTKYRTTINGTFVTTASDKTTVVVLLPVPHVRSADEVINMLLLHMAHHFHLGVHQYVMYIQQYVNDYAHDKRVQALVRAGRLALVSWDDLPSHEQTRYTAQILDLYYGQMAIINHAFAALYGDDVIVHKLDLDEYLLTPVKGQDTIKTWHKCAKNKLSVDSAGQSSLCLSRYNAILTPRWQRKSQQLWRSSRASRKLVSDADWARADYYLWQDWYAAGPEKRAAEYSDITHPIQFYEMAEHVDKLMNYKTLDDPGAILGGHVHWTYPNKRLNMLQWDADPECARVAHFWNLNGLRKNPGSGQEPIAGSQWDWPAREAAAAV